VLSLLAIILEGIYNKSIHEKNNSEGENERKNEQMDESEKKGEM